MVPQNGWFINNGSNPMNKTDDLGVITPIFGKHPFSGIFRKNTTFRLFITWSKLAVCAVW